jgi:hypothetical protein
MEDNLNGRQPQWKMTSMEEDFNGRLISSFFVCFIENENFIYNLSIKPEVLQNI